jgi:hypothetical protein
VIKKLVAHGEFSPWNQNSFLYYTCHDQARFIRNQTIRFMEVRRETFFPNDWFRENQIPCVAAWLVCLKEGPRYPGPIEI